MATASSLSSHRSRSSNNSAEIYYSNDDIAIIHNIVVLAQQLLPTLPEHERFPTTALFSAYYDILPRNGISPAGETRFSRILFKIGGLRGERPLVEKFEEVLSGMGIDVEFTKEVSENATDEEDYEPEDLPPIKSTAKESPIQQKRLHQDLRNRSQTFPRDGAEWQQELPADNDRILDISVPNDIATSLGDADAQTLDRRRRRNSESSKWDFDTKPDFNQQTRRNSFSAEPHHQFAYSQANLNLLDAKASLVRQRSLRSKTIRQLLYWRDLALEIREDNVDLEAIAEHRDRKVLLQGALSDWRSRTKDKQLAQQSDQALVALARRHIVRMRVFNAWKSIVLANKIKRTQHLMKKYFTIWKENVGVRIRQQKAADAFYKSKLRRRVLGIKSIHDDGQESPQSRELLQEGPHPSRVPNERVSIGGVNQLISQDVKQIHTNNQISAGNSQRYTSAVEVWRLRCLKEAEAIQIDRGKVVRQALINWQDKIRAIILSGRIIARIVSEHMYRLVLANRALAFIRKVDERIKRDVFECWTFRTRAATTRRLANEEAAQSHLNQQRRSLFLKVFTSSKEHHNEHESKAVEFRNNRVLRGKVAQWKGQSQDVDELERWSKDAHYYFVASKSLNKWKSVAETSRREKRKEAYVQMRRIKKMNLARGALRIWRDKFHDKALLQDQGQQATDNKTVVIGMDMLDRWRGRVEDALEMEVSAQGFQLRKALAIWRNRVNSIQSIQVEAAATYAERQEKYAVKKWSLQTLKNRGQTNYALDVHGKNLKRSFRRSFTLWQQKTASRQNPAPELSTPLRPASATTLSNRRSGFAASRRAREALELSNIPETLSPVLPEEFGPQEPLASIEQTRSERNLKETIPLFQTGKVVKGQSMRLRQELLEGRKEPVELDKARVAFRHSEKPTRLPQRRLGQSTNPSSVRRSNSVDRFENMLDEGDQVNIVDDWVEDSVERQNLPLSRYLDTPSKQATRPIDSTTPAALLSTPIERRLRAQYSGGLMQSFRRSKVDRNIKQEISMKGMQNDNE